VELAPDGGNQSSFAACVFVVDVDIVVVVVVVNVFVFALGDVTFSRSTVTRILLLPDGDDNRDFDFGDVWFDDDDTTDTFDDDAADGFCDIFDEEGDATVTGTEMRKPLTAANAAADGVAPTCTGRVAGKG
jgi:hypothetical protein